MSSSPADTVAAPAPDRIVVHHLNNSRSQRILWLLEELGVPYDVVRYQRNAKTMLAPPELRAIHPLGKSPVVVDQGDVLAESGNIIETLTERYDPGHRVSPAPGTAEYVRYRYWLHYAEGSLMPPLLLSLVFGRIRSTPVPFFIKPITRSIADKGMAGFVGPQLKLHLAYLEAELAKHAWFAGEEFSAADIQLSFPIEAANARGGLGDYPRLAGFLSRIHGRAAYQAALGKGGPYDLLK